jgi:hypothetical protein
MRVAGMLASGRLRGLRVALLCASCASLPIEARAQPPPQPYPYPATPYQPYPYAPAPYGYPPPYAMPPPVPAQPQPPAVVYDWDPDVPVPPGYTMVDTVNNRLLVPGVTLFATGWVLSVLIAGIGSSAEKEDTNDAADGVTAGDWTPLYIPAVGPFFTIGTLDPSPAGTGLLLADGVLQVGGAIGIIFGFIDRKYKLLRTTYGSLSVSPIAAPHFRGLLAGGRF